MVKYLLSFCLKNIHLHIFKPLYSLTTNKIIMHQSIRQVCVHDLNTQKPDHQPKSPSIKYIKRFTDKKQPIFQCQITSLSINPYRMLQLVSNVICHPLFRRDNTNIYKILQLYYEIKTILIILKKYLAL